MARYLAFILVLCILIAACVYGEKSPESFSVVTVGTGSPQYDENRGGPSALIRYGDQNYLVDMGQGTQAQLHKLGVNPRRLSGLLFTHHHLDHNAEFVPIFINVYLSGKKFEVVGPLGTKEYVEFILKFYAQDIAYRHGRRGGNAQELTAPVVRELQGGEEFTLGPLKVTTARVHHSIHTVAYRFEANSRSIVISGDLRYSDSLVTLAKGADVLVIDAGSSPVKKGEDLENLQERGEGRPNRNKIQKAHSSRKEVGEMAQKAGVKQLVLTHIVPGDVDEALTQKALAPYFSGKIILGYDGMEIIPGKLATTQEPTEKPTTQDTEEKSTTPETKTNETHVSGKHRYTVVDTGQDRCYSDEAEIAYPTKGARFYGQDAQYEGAQLTYKDNGDGTITDLATGLMWQKNFDLGRKQTFAEAKANAAKCKTGGYKDWRLPTIKELYSLMDFRGIDPSGPDMDTSKVMPFLDNKYFDFIYGDTSKGERPIDAQYWSATEYVGLTMDRQTTVFGVNFADGRIKGYPRDTVHSGRTFRGFVRYVRGGLDYGKNDFQDNHDGTITDRATGLIWQKDDSQKPMNWEQALEYASKLQLADQDDWRLPDAKELQSIVDYTRAPDAKDKAHQGPAIDPIFRTSDPESYFWTSTTHLQGRMDAAYTKAVYICFGQSMGCMQFRGMDKKEKMNVHGAGAQRSDPKSGDPEQFLLSRAPQGDDTRIFNYVRCVRGGDKVKRTSGPALHKKDAKREQGKLDHGNRGQTPKKRFISRLDQDGDGKVSPEEFDGPDRAFDRFDTNHDGFISEEEAPQGPPSGPR